MKTPTKKQRGQYNKLANDPIGDIAPFFLVKGRWWRWERGDRYSVFGINEDEAAQEFRYNEIETFSEGNGIYDNYRSEK